MKEMSYIELKMRSQCYENYKKLKRKSKNGKVTLKFPSDFGDEVDIIILAPTMDEDIDFWSEEEIKQRGRMKMNLN